MGKGISHRKKDLDLFSQGFWERIWKDMNVNFMIRENQETYPERWDLFYDIVSDILLDLWGERWKLGNTVAMEMVRQGILRKGISLLDVACGPGTFSIPIAQLGAMVTALDRSEGMLRELRAEAKQRGLEDINCILADWKDHRQYSPYELVMAAFFPQALEPSGIERLEGLSSGTCLIVLGTGEDAFSFRRILWAKVMDEPFPKSKYQLTCSVNYLLTSGRMPNMLHISMPIRMDISLDNICRFYMNYFALFGKEDPSLEGIIRNVLTYHAMDGRLRASGELNIAILWWQGRRIKG